MCVSQSTTIININFIAVTTNTVTPFIGQAIDALGAPFVAYCMSIVAWMGTLLLTLAAQYEMDGVYYVAFCLLGLATFTGSLLSVQVGLYFNGMTQVRIIMFLNALFDAGSVTYLLLWGIQSYFDFSFVTVTRVYFGLAIVVYGGASYFWKTAVPEESKDDDDDWQEEKREEASLLTLDQQELLNQNTVGESLRAFQMSQMDKEMLTDAFMSLRGGIQEGTGHVPLEALYGSIRHEEVSATGDEYIPVSQRSPRDQLLSTPFLCLTLFFAISMTSCNWSLATAADYLAAMGDDGTYLAIFTLMQPASILSLPIVDATVNNLGFGAAFQAVNILNFVYIFIKLTLMNLNVQIVHFVLVAVVRCYLYAVTFSFLPSLLSSDAVGKGTGFLYMIGGLTSFVNIPLSHWAGQVGFGPPNLLYLSVVVPCVAFVRVVQKIIEKENAHK